MGSDNGVGRCGERSVVGVYWWAPVIGMLSPVLSFVFRGVCPGDDGRNVSLAWAV